MQRFTDSQTWYVVFDRSTIKRWWNIFLNEEWRHITLWRDMGDGSLRVDPLAHALAIQHFDMPIDEVIADELRQGCTAILCMTVHYGMLYRKQTPDPFTCVSVAKRLLGINKILFTPHGLYNEMLRAGATAIKAFTPNVNYANLPVFEVNSDEQDFQNTAN